MGKHFIDIGPDWIEAAGAPNQLGGVERVIWQPVLVA